MHCVDYIAIMGTVTAVLSPAHSPLLQQQTHYRHSCPHYRGVYRCEIPHITLYCLLLIDCKFLKLYIVQYDYVAYINIELFICISAHPEKHMRGSERTEPQQKTMAFKQLNDDCMKKSNWEEYETHC